jgi:hypothetical protein
VPINEEPLPQPPLPHTRPFCSYCTPALRRGLLIWE